MRNMLRKAVSILLMIATMFSISVQPVMAAPSMAETVNNGLEMIEQDFTDTTIYAKYYLTMNGETLLYTEYGEIVNNTFVLNSTSVKVDENKNPILSTQITERYVEPIVSAATNDVTLRSSCEYKPHTETFSFKADKWTLGLITQAIVTATGLAAGTAGVIAGALIDSVASGLISTIPDSVYFDGERCVSRSTGKIYYRYRGNFYNDSSKSVLLAENVSWSRRWGH